MLSLQDVQKRYGPRAAVKGVSLSLAAGEVFGLLGPNGAGKTTTLRMAVGLSAPDQGSVLLRGIGSPSLPRVRERIGYAPQSLCLYDELSARENVRLMAGLYGLAGKVAEHQVDWALDFVSLRPRANDRVESFSVGMKRRLTLATAIVHKPLLLVLDEPTAGVDPQSRRALFEGVRALRDLSMTVLYTTHAMEEAELLCDRVAIMDDGRIVTMGPVHDLLAFRSAPARQVEPPATVRSGSHLEQLFLELTGRELRDT